MDDTSLSTPSTAEHAPLADSSRGDRRRRAREILSTQNSRLDRLEGELTERLQQVADEIARELSAAGGDQAVAVADAAYDARVTALSQQVDRLRAELSAREDALQRVMSEAEQVRIERGTFEQELRVRDALVSDAQSRDERTRVELAAAVQQLADVQARLAAAGERLGELDRMTAALEQARIEAARLEQELRVREALVSEAQSHEERDRVELANAVAAAEARLNAAGERLAEADRMAAALAQARIEADRVQQELRVRDAQLADLHARDESNRAELAAIIEQRNDDQSQLTAAQAQLAAAVLRLEEADRAAAELELARIETGKLGQELRVRDALLAETQNQQEKSRVELAAAIEQLNDGQAQLAIARQRQEELRREAAAARTAAETVHSTGAADHDSQLARLHEALEAAHSENNLLVGQLSAAPASGGDSEELKKLRKERDSLTKKLNAAETKLKEALETVPDTETDGDLQRRLEMAVEDLLEMKRVNSELETKLKNRGGGASSAVASTGAMDWEAQKQAMLASWADDDRDDEGSVAERESIESTIRITDQVVEQKDQEIAELKRLLEERSSGGTADAAAVAELLDHDEVIRQEREKLVQTQAEWREKIGKAEIDISMERAAKIARDRTQLEEKLRVYQSEQADRPSDGSTQSPEKPTRGRWLERLGLKDLNEE